MSPAFDKLIKLMAENVVKMIRGFLKDLLKFVWKIILKVINKVAGLFYDVVKTQVFGLVEKMKSSFDEFILERMFKSVIERATEMVATMVTDLWNNYMDAQRLKVMLQKMIKFWFDTKN